MKRKYKEGRNQEGSKLPNREEPCWLWKKTNIYKRGDAKIERNKRMNTEWRITDNGNMIKKLYTILLTRYYREHM